MDQQPPRRSLTLDLDDQLLQSALLEAMILLDQLRAHPLPEQARVLVRRCQLRLTYFYGHSRAADAQRPTNHLLGLIDSFHPELARSLGLLPRLNHEQLQTAHRPEV